MKTLLSLTLLSNLIYASLFDFNYLGNAKEAYNDKNYSKAEELYKKVDLEEARFNLADTLYRQKKYKEALQAYNIISDEKLQFKKLHNIGNTHAKMNKIDDAIKSYEEALNLKDDSDTKFNLELLKKKKEEEKKDKNKNDKNKKDDKKEDKEQNKKKEKKQEDEKKEKKQDETKKQDQKEKQEKMDKEKQPPITNMEEKKWQKMLNQRGVNTLMIPLNNKGEKRNETNPW
jgi:Ca-activated chloride channel family protein